MFFLLLLGTIIEASSQHKSVESEDESAVGPEIRPPEFLYKLEGNFYSGSRPLFVPVNYSHSVNSNSSDDSRLGQEDDAIEVSDSYSDSQSEQDDDAINNEFLLPNTPSLELDEDYSTLTRQVFPYIPEGRQSYFVPLSDKNKVNVKQHSPIDDKSFNAENGGKKNKNQSDGVGGEDIARYLPSLSGPPFEIDSNISPQTIRRHLKGESMKVVGNSDDFNRNPLASKQSKGMKREGSTAYEKINRDFFNPKNSPDQLTENSISTADDEAGNVEKDENRKYLSESARQEGIDSGLHSKSDCDFLIRTCGYGDYPPPKNNSVSPLFVEKPNYTGKTLKISDDHRLVEGSAPRGMGYLHDTTNALNGNDSSAINGKRKQDEYDGFSTGALSFFIALCICLILAGSFAIIRLRRTFIVASTFAPPETPLPTSMADVLLASDQVIPAAEFN